MRKLVWFFIILFAAVLILSIVAHFVPEVKTAVGGALEGIGGTVWNTLSGTWAYLGSVAGASGLNFLIATCVIFAVGLVSAGFMHSLWNRRPKILGGAKTQGSTITLQTNPPPSPPQTIKVKPEEKPAEAPPA